MENNKEKYIKGLIDELKNIKYIMPQDIPNIDLYMDQVTTFMDEKLKSSKRYSEDKLLTKTMINNYTKNELLPPPNKKKYSKEHLFLLIFIYYFKTILSINDIKALFEPLVEKYFDDNPVVNLEEIYTEIFVLEQEQVDSLTKDLIRKMLKAKESFSTVENEEDKDFLSMFSFICMLSFDIYMKKQILEKMIDNLIKPEKNDTGKKDTPKKDASKKDTSKKENETKK
ncbi:MAG TPA: DUF1836 domain-containing protein [Clostridiales bacterium]|nr:DUF1836 domain-containing protein [Clostridiales bacterium]